jgi:hypothetical protein
VTKVGFILAAIICASPAIILWDGLIAQGVVSGAVAIVLGVSAGALRPNETEFVISTIRPALVAASVPALWILLQAIPLGVLAHPVWTSTQIALAHPIRGTISIDPGTSVVALSQYLSLGAVAFLSAAVAADRQRADRLLFALTLASSIIALIAITHRWLFPSFSISPYATAQMLDCVAIGTVIAAAACVREFERHEPNDPGDERSLSLSKLSIPAIALMICVVAVVLSGTRQLLIAAGCGVASLACVMLIRRYALGVWGATAIVAAAICFVAVLAANQPTQHGTSLLLAFAEQPEASSTAISERVLDDAPMVGTGAGTFGALATIYREIDDPASSPVASTAAAALAIELGWPLVWLIAAASVSAIFLLLRAALQRRRDSFYPAMGGSCLITLLLCAFVNPGLLGTTTGLLTATVLGLAFVQSKSRTSQL